MRSHEWGRLLTARDASGSYGIQMFGVRREQGRLAEIAPVVRLLGGSARDSAWGPGLIAVLAELGMVDDARRELGRLVGDGIGALRPSLWVAALGVPHRRMCRAPATRCSRRPSIASSCRMRARTPWSGTSSPATAPPTATSG